MQESGGESLLTDLCAICHANPIKYTCPRCGIHTCSLPCVKRHKTWAQCSGTRNPAAYRKRADLATPASVDQDFNFITSVERSLQRADELVVDKGIALAPSGLRRQEHGQKNKFDIAVEERGIRLIRAPQGLTRNKQNKSRWNGPQSCIMWTTEWICHDGTTRLENVTELKTVGEAFVHRFGRKALLKKRKWSGVEIANVPTVQDENPAGQPTQEEAPQGLTGAKQDDTAAVQPTEKEAQRDLPGAEQDDNAAVQPSQEEAPQDFPGTEQDDFPAVQPIQEEAPQASFDAQKDVGRDKPAPDDTPPIHEDSQVVNTSSEAITTTPESETAYLLHNLHFYLLRPNTTAKLKCLLPISQTSTLKDVLRDRTLLEFPTFYVRPEPPEALPAPFITEEEYNNKHGTELPIDLPSYTPEDAATNEPPIPLADIDEKKVLEVLQKDLIG